MKSYKNLRLIIYFLLLSSWCFAQDPTCEYVITLRNVDTLKYDYRFFTEEREYHPIDTIKKHLTKNPFNLIGGEHTESSVAKASSGKMLITTYTFGYCYQSWARILVTRRNKEDGLIELMYCNTNIAFGLPNYIEIDNFHPGERTAEVYLDSSTYRDAKNINYGHKQTV